MMTSRASLALLPLLLIACDSSEASRGAGGTVIDTVGDTIVARSSGSGRWGDSVAVRQEVSIGELDGADAYTFGMITGAVEEPDGSILVLDAQVPVVRRYSPEGKHLGDVGRKGSGPGELLQPTDLELLPDGRIIVSDPRNARINVYTRDGAPVETWPIPGNSFASDQLQVTGDGAVFVRIGMGTPASPRALMRVGPAGTPADTILFPTDATEQPMLIAQRIVDGVPRMTSRNPVPFTTGMVSALMPDGRFLQGTSDRYVLEHARADGKLFRIEKHWEPARLDPDEKAYNEEWGTAMMRNTDPSWRWNGPPIPDTKPAFRSITVGAEGRIWVSKYTPGERIPDAEPAESWPGGPKLPAARWRSPTAYDVFEADGTYLGEVVLPARSALLHASGDGVILRLRDDLDVQRVARFRLEPAAR